MLWCDACQLHAHFALTYIFRRVRWGSRKIHCCKLTHSSATRKRHFIAHCRVSREAGFGTSKFLRIKRNFNLSKAAQLHIALLPFSCKGMWHESLHVSLSVTNVQRFIMENKMRSSAFRFLKFYAFPARNSIQKSGKCKEGKQREKSNVTN